MTNTETCMREMRYITALFFKSSEFDEQWVLFKAYLNTVHSLSDNDPKAKTNFINNEIMDFALVLRNVIHHHPAKWNFGKHDVYPTGMTVNLSNETGAKFTGKLSLVIQKNTLENTELQEKLGKESKKQLAVLKNALEKIQGHVLIVAHVIQQIQAYVEQYCRDNNLYTEAYDKEPSGYKLIKTV